MSLFEIILIAVSLAMDSFAVSITAGLILKEFNSKHFIRIAFYMGFFQSLMPVIGWMIGTSFRHYIISIDHWVAFFLLLGLGGKMIYDDLKCEEDHCCFNPEKRCVVIGLALATSLDALVVGVNFAFLDMSIITPVYIIGLTSFVLSFIGIFIGCKLGAKFNWKFTLIGGLVLIGLGTNILYEHLTF
ncbi:manganese efflux pump MntP family protein [Ancylomarina sp. 16SWW S1-10-2]|uniref:manganese efflux pump MntP n=1 Tax=Ancylomarina sp. 16SWW S1-10-2 TaxID=2499681 RepID=UPI0012ADCB8C|nr:manganese efflux pump MntP family protein [Ancylomarina sp. 16SWW S1-10-2]MRT94826.1 manganese efflux pump [Ancylomarina sp. 16SWW S1-10-2]